MRAIRTPAPPDPDWLGAFLAELARVGVAPATSRGYAYDLRHFLAWHASQPGGFALDRLGPHDLIAYRQQLLAAGCRPATINRRLAALRRLSRWAHAAGLCATTPLATSGRCAPCATGSPPGSPMPRCTPCCARPAPRRTGWLRATTRSCS